MIWPPAVTRGKSLHLGAIVMSIDPIFGTRMVYISTYDSNVGTYFKIEKLHYSNYPILINEYFNKIHYLDIINAK